MKDGGTMVNIEQRAVGLRRIRVIDSHTGGEPTRLVFAGGPDLGDGSLSAQLLRFRKEHDDFRRAVVQEPRGSDVLVGALLCQPSTPDCSAGVIFFNNVGYLGMCGHGTIGLIASLAYLGRIRPGTHSVDTPVGIIRTTLHENGSVTVQNVPSYRAQADVTLEVPRHGRVTGDIAWGGNWFFLVKNNSYLLNLENVEQLIDFAWAIRQSLKTAQITGDSGAEIDHIELYGPPSQVGFDSKNFVLCPGKAYDRSPCGTGTSAKMACLYADGKLEPGEPWRQESIVGSVFEGSIEISDGALIPSITGTAHIIAEADLILDSRDPFCLGIPTDKQL